MRYGEPPSKDTGVVKPSLLRQAFTRALWLSALRLSRFCGVDVDKPVLRSLGGGSGLQPRCRDLDFYKQMTFNGFPTWTGSFQVGRFSGQKVWLEEIRVLLDLAGRRHVGRRACLQRGTRVEDVPMRGAASTGDTRAQDLHRSQGDQH